MDDRLVQALAHLARARAPEQLREALRQAAALLGLAVLDAPPAASAVALRDLTGRVAGWLTEGAGASELAAAWLVAEAHCRWFAERREVRDPLRDPATGLWSARGIQDRLAAEVARAARLGDSLVVMVLSAPDQDRLQTLLLQRVRASDYVGVLDGRLCVVLPGADSAAAQSLFAKLAERLAPARLSGGAAHFRGQETALDLIEDALLAHEQAQEAPESRLLLAPVSLHPDAEPASQADAGLPHGILPAEEFERRARRILQLALLKGGPLVVVHARGAVKPPPLTLSADIPSAWGAVRDRTVGLVAAAPAQVLAALSPSAPPDGGACRGAGAEASPWCVYVWDGEETLADLFRRALA